MLGGNKQNDEKAPEQAQAKGEKKPLDPKKIEQQNDGSCEQSYVVGDVVKMTEGEMKMDEKTKKEVFAPKKEQSSDMFVVKSVSGKEIVLEKKDFK